MKNTNNNINSQALTSKSATPAVISNGIINVVAKKLPKKLITFRKLLVFIITGRHLLSSTLSRQPRGTRK